MLKAIIGEGTVIDLFSMRNVSKVRCKTFLAWV